MKKRNISVNSDLKTGFFCKFCLILGLLLLVIYLIIISVPLFVNADVDSLQFIYDFSQSDMSGSLLAFSIIFLGIGAILYFFHCQFAKLAKIADEIENEEDFEVE
jgi:hypothetical protein